jgi:hypothetical protein
MESQSKEKRSKTLQFIALGSLIALSSTMTGCTKATTISSKDKEKEENNNNNTTGGYHYYSSRVRAPLASSGTSKPAFGSVSRGWFGGFHFSGG